MKAIIYVFSGTGNTRLVGELYKKYLTGFETEIYDVRMHKDESGKFVYDSFPDPNSADLTGFAFPIHGFNPPKAFYKFCKQLPALTTGKKSFIFKTGGEGLHFNDYAGQKLIRMMEKKGYSFLSERLYVMPYNMIFRHSPEMVKNEWVYADAQARLHCKWLLEEKQTKVRKNPLKAWFVPIVRIEWIYAQAQGPAMHVNMKKCTKCQKCVRNCPLNNIQFKDGKFKFGTNCALCVSCSFGCPQNAISIGLLNGWKVNGDYKIIKTAKDSSINFPAFDEKTRGLKRAAYYDFYKRLDKDFEANGIELNFDL